MGAYASQNGETTETSTEEGEEQSNILTPKEGRVTFWEWEKLTKTNYKRLLDDGNYHAALITQKYTNYGISNVYTTKHISTNSDANHI